MAPGWTSYHNRLQYQIYDVTELLDTENKIETQTEGWYKGILGFTCEPNIMIHRQEPLRSFMLNMKMEAKR